MSGTIYAGGINRQIVLSEETGGYGVQAPGPGQVLRRTNFSMDDQPPEIASNEITQHAQLLSTRLGVPTVPGALSGELSPGTYKSIFEGLLRGTWTAGATSGAMSDTAVTTVAGPPKAVQLQSTSTDFLAKGFKVGDVVRFSGLTGSVSTFNGLNLQCVSVQQHDIIFAATAGAGAALYAAIASWGTQAAATLAVTGKKLLMPLQSQQVTRSYSIEDWQADIAKSRLGRGIMFSQVSLNVQPNGLVAFQASFNGKNMDRPSAQVYATPTAESSAIAVGGANGAISYPQSGSLSPLGYITGFNLQLSLALQPVPVVGATDGVAATFAGVLSARGSITALLTGDTLSDDFLKENEVQVGLMLPSAPTQTADFVSLLLPRARLMSDNRQDSDRAIMRTLNLVGLQQVSGGSGTQYDNTTIVMQDSLA